MRKRNAVRTIFIAASAIALVLSYGARAIRLNIFPQNELLQKMQVALWLFDVFLLLTLLIQFLLSNCIYKGPRYFWYHWRVKNKLEKQMLDAGFGIQRNWYVSLPKIKLSFAKGFSTGLLKVQNTVKHDKKLDDVTLSSALGKFIVECHHQTDDANYYVYELIDGSVSFKLTFKTYKEFLHYNATIPPYMLFLDKRSHLKLQHSLIVGQTGSGKSYFLYQLILEMIHKEVPYNLYIADPKRSGLTVLGETINPERTAVDFEDILQLLEQFVDEMHKRKSEVKELLKSRLDADYSTFGLSPYVFIFDEYASYATVLNSSSIEKKVRDKVKALLYEVVLQGRQLGFFLIVAAQQSNSTLLETALRDNLPLKVCLGESETQTYVTCFGHAQIPNRHYAVGEGVFTEPTLAPEPKLVQCPYCDFDILAAVNRTGVM